MTRALRTLIMRVSLGGAAVTATGCSNALLFTTATQTGIELNAIEGGRQTIRVGYSRAEGVVMPVRESCDGKPRQEAFSVLSASHFETGNLLLGDLGATKIKTVFATGKAAATPGAPAAVGNTFKAMVGYPFSAEAAWLRKELRGSFKALAENPARNAEARQAVWKALAGGGTPSPRRYAIILVQRETNQEGLQAMLVEAKRATGRGDALADEEKKNPQRAVIDLVNGTTGSEQENVLNAIGPFLPGPDEIAGLNEDQIVLALVDQAAERDETVPLRAALAATLSAERGG